MLFGCGLVDEALVEVVDQVRRAPVELRAHRGHVRRGEAGQHHTAPWRAKEIDERLDVGRFVVVRRADAVRIEEHGAKAGDDPRPRSDCVVRDVEEQSRQHTVTFGLRREDSLRDVSAAARLGAGIPGGPPLHAEEDAECQERHPGIRLDAVAAELDRQNGDCRRFTAEVLRHADSERGDPADGLHRVHGENDHRRHFDHELHEIRPQHRPHARRDRVAHRHQEADADGDHLTGHIDTGDVHVAKPERDGENLDHRPRHPAEDDQVDRDREVERPEAAKHRRSFAAVADLGELDVSHDVGPPPESGEEEHREHAAHQHVPPQPVAGDPVREDEARDDERGVGGEGCRHHRCAGEPPGHLATGQEVLVHALAAPLCEQQANDGGEREVGDDDCPIDPR